MRQLNRFSEFVKGTCTFWSFSEFPFRESNLDVALILFFQYYIFQSINIKNNPLYMMGISVF